MLRKKEVIIYIHGITPKKEPRDHSIEYNSFENLLQEAFEKKGKGYPSKRIDIEWGLNLPNVVTNDRILAGVEGWLCDQSEGIAKKECDFTLNPLRYLHYRIRENFLLGFADMFYYVSEDGKAELRQNVLNTLLKNLPGLKDDEVYSFTIVAHSAGTVIMHDVLFILFGGSSKNFLQDDSLSKLERLQGYAQSGQLFIKCFVTLGSPITPMIIRSWTLMERIDKGELLEPYKIGIRNDALGRSMWLNFWDKDDVISYPVKFLYDDPDNLIKDKYISICDCFPKAHNVYWTSKKIAEIVAEKY
ncbi:MAG: hypothetical protein ISS16_03275 [Ignavibacteria bacterium]|nr:hypothetical protein [Ignavibacteria bacterium]